MATSVKPRNSIAEAGHLHQFQIFLASPGDVPLERKLAREAINHINNCKLIVLGNERCCQRNFRLKQL